MVFVTRRERFSAAHKLFREEWNDEQNFDVFGKCSYPNWHGHNYILYVTIKGELNPETGFVVNIKKLSEIIKEHVISKLDHRNLNIDVDFMKDTIASTENLAIAIWNVLEPIINLLGVHLHKIKIEETENNFVEYYGS
ncbi:MAG: 6-carboxytetrahydropterin synthase [Bacteroidales bacterium]|nr:6-carboxytetrahydropterin synthase [Bacteroidales bacterium]